MNAKTIKILLIANRGEIACRIIRTAQQQGIKCIAVYSDVDKNSQHVLLADEAYYIGPSAAADSYLCVDKLLDVAKKSNADAVHPGYGFLSENSQFANECKNHNVIFVGPPIDAIESMGSKSQAKQIMLDAGVPVVSGYHGDIQDQNKLLSEANKIGFPLLIKATAGGGGKGMRIVHHEEDFIEELNSCKREAISSFGDDRVLLERYLTKPRHIEIQVFADSHGNVIHCFERDCSVQRRHQKIIEEAPAPNFPNATREAMGQVAINAAKAIGYQGAGTVEFLYDEDGSFYFMEMNTRLQVEHPVTEKITGLDLVHWQLEVACGKPLPLKQEQIEMHGHAFEARVYAEDPYNDFLPSTGKIDYLNLPKESNSVRIDSGVVGGDEISIFYDPMIAKLIVWSKDRRSALLCLRQALAQFRIAGLSTNLEFLHSLASFDPFINEELDTHFLDRHGEELFSASEKLTTKAIAAATFLEMTNQVKLSKAHSSDPFSPWNESNGWRLNEDNYHVLNFVHDNQPIQVTAHFRDNGFLLEMDNKEILFSGKIEENTILLTINGQQCSFGYFRHNHKITLFNEGATWVIDVDNQQAMSHQEESQSNFTSPMPGTIINLFVEAGDIVKQGEPVAVIEAMKMEHTLKAHCDLQVNDVLFAIGDLVGEGAEIILFESVVES